MKFQPGMAVAIWLLVASVFFSPAGAQGTAAPSKAVFTFGGMNERRAALFVGKDMGFFQKYGLDAQIVHVRSGPVGIAALAAGESQFHAGSATGAALGAMARGLDAVFIAGLINRADGLFVVAPKIKTPADLKGKTLGVQSIGGGIWMYCILALEHWGIDPERDGVKFRVLGDEGVLAQAMTTGMIDGTVLSYAHGSGLERQGYRILADLTTLGIPYQGLGIMTSKRLLQQSPDLAERVLRAVVEAIAFIREPGNRLTVMRSVAKGLRLPRIEDAADGYQIVKESYDKRIYPNREGIRNVVRLLGRSNEALRRLKVEDVIDDRIVRKLEKEGLF